MSKEKQFWAPLSKRGGARNHLWKRDDFPDFWCESACGLRRHDEKIVKRWVYAFQNRCKKCEASK